jgi:hypothetical protein
MQGSLLRSGNTGGGIYILIVRSTSRYSTTHAMNHYDYKGSIIIQMIKRNILSVVLVSANRGLLYSLDSISVILSTLLLSHMKLIRKPLEQAREVTVVSS